MVCGPRATAIRDVASATGDVGWSIASCQSTFGRSALKLLFGVSVYSFGGELPSGRPPPPARVRARPQPATIDRKSVVEGKSVSVRVDLGGRRILKQKKHRENTTTTA